MLTRPLILLSACCSIAQAVNVYLSPTPESFQSTLSPEDATLALSRHLGLDAFESFRVSGDSAYSEEYFVGKGPKNALLVTVDEMDVPAIIPHSLQRPAFTLATPPSTSINPLSSALSAYLHRASASFSSIFSSFDFGDSIDISSLRDFVTNAVQPSFAAVELSKLQAIRKRYGKSSQQYTQATETLRALLEDVLVNDRNTLAILTYAASYPASMVKRDAPQESQVPFPLPGPQQPIGAVSTCFTSLDICNNSTSTCSGRGQCAEATKAGRTCFVCTCGTTTTGEGNNVKTTYWAGESCERKDISSPFVLITGTVVVIILLFAGAVSLLYSVGDQSLPSTLLATAVPVKKD